MIAREEPTRKINRSDYTNICGECGRAFGHHKDRCSHEGGLSDPINQMLIPSRKTWGSRTQRVLSSLHPMVIPLLGVGGFLLVVSFLFFLVWYI